MDTVTLENNVKLDQLLLSNPKMEKRVIAIIRRVIRQARKQVGQAAEGVLQNDPRKTAHAIRSSVYKALFGGNINILSSKKAGTPGTYEPPRKLQPGQRGGNRIPRSRRTEQMLGYQGFDRNFVLRWINDGTNVRTSRYGNRGAIAARPWFGNAATNAMNQADNEFSQLLDKLIEKEMQS